MWQSARLPAPPLREELRGLELGQVAAQCPRQAAGLRGLGVPEQRDLAGRDLEHLDVVARRPPAEERRAAARPAHAELELAVGLHAARTAAARSSSRSPWKTRPSIATAGTSSTPAVAASSVASSRRVAIEPSSAPLSSAVGCISHAAAAISTLSR